MAGKHKPDYFQVAQGVWGLKILFVNIFIISDKSRGDKNWVLVDAGLKGSGKRIIRMAEALFGRGTKPAAIILTHGHFDHVGALPELLSVWDVKVYAHKLELPYLTGLSPYPPADPTVGGGLMSLMAWAYPTKPIDISNRLMLLGDNEKIHFIPDWRVIHTPGHTPGHISLFRELNATLIAGDAFVTTKNESAVHALTYMKKISGPPKYFTPDWVQAAHSVRRLASLQPRIAATGHGKVMLGRELKTELTYLVNNFSQIAVPAHGRYVNRPAIANEHGTTYVPSFKVNSRFVATLALGAALAGFLIVSLKKPA